MNYNVLTIPPFDRQLKRLAKKYPSVKTDFLGLIKALRKEPKSGTPLGNNCFKIRLAITSKGKGKSGGARVITNFVVQNDTIFLLSIYDKSEQESITDSELKGLLSLIN